MPSEESTCSRNLKFQVRIGGDSGLPVTLSHPDSVVSQALMEITEKIAAQISMAAVNKD